MQKSRLWSVQAHSCNGKEVSEGGEELMRRITWMNVWMMLAHVGNCRDFIFFISYAFWLTHLCITTMEDGQHYSHSMDEQTEPHADRVKNPRSYLAKDHKVITRNFIIRRKRTWSKEIHSVPTRFQNRNAYVRSVIKNDDNLHEKLFIFIPCNNPLRWVLSLFSFNGWGNWNTLVTYPK